MLCALFISAGAQSIPVNANPLKAGGEKGYAPLRPGYVIDSTPIGYSYITDSDEYPAIFLRVTGGLDLYLGYYRARFAYKTADGSLVYQIPEKITIPEGLSLSQGTFFSYKGKTLALWAGSSGSIIVTEYDDQNNSLTETGSIKTAGLGRYISMSAYQQADGNAILTVASRDASVYFPTDGGGDIDAQSYYNGAEMFRGILPKGGVRQIILDIDNLTSVGNGTWVSKDETYIISPASAIKIQTPTAGVYGNVVTNTLGSIRYITDKNLSQYVWAEGGDSLMKHPTQGAVAIPYPTATKEVTSMLVGGEGAIYHYELNGFKASGEPIFNKPKAILMENGDLYAGSVATPNVVDWDGDGILDLVVGNSEGRLLFFKNNGTNEAPDFALPEEVLSGGNPICFRPGYHVVQGPLEASWGYMGPTVFDWNGDSLPDVIFSGSDSKFWVMINKGTKTNPQLDIPRTLSIDNLELWGPWRVRPAVAKINDRNCIVIVDQDNALHLYWQVDDYNVEDGGKLQLTDGNYITGHQTTEKRLGNNFGRARMALVDWDGDGNLDLLLGCMRGGSFPRPKDGLPFFRKDAMGNKIYGLQVLIFINKGTNEAMKFDYPGQVQIDGKDFYMGIHENSPTPCGLGDLSNGINLLVGVESGKLMFFEHSHITTIKNTKR
jgi:hypothetical protein